MGYLRFTEVRRRVGLSRSTIWRLERQGLFVKRRRLSANAVGWPEDEIEAWLRARLGVGGERSLEPQVESSRPLLAWLRQKRRKVGTEAEARALPRLTGPAGRRRQP